MAAAEYFKEYYLKNKKRICEREKRKYEKDKERIKARCRAYYYANHEIAKRRKLDWQQKNKERYRKYQSEYRLKNSELLSIKARAYFQKKKHIRAALQNSRYKNDPIFRASRALRSRLVQALKCRGIRKHLRTVELVGCRAWMLKRWIEIQFKKGMTWRNHGEWHVDHVIPCAAFDLTTEEGQKECFHWTNLQPLWKIENLSKGARISSKP